jgi:hypothetical protein
LSAGNVNAVSTAWAESSDANGSPVAKIKRTSEEEVEEFAVEQKDIEPNAGIRAMIKSVHYKCGLQI